MTITDELDVVVVLHRSAPHVRACLDSVRRGTRRVVRLFLVDNGGGDDGPQRALHAWPDAELIEPRENLGFGAACNLALAAGQAPFVLLLNPDATVEEGAIDQLVEAARLRPEVGAAGGLVLRADGLRIDTAGLALRAPGFAHDPFRDHPRTSAPPTGEVDALSGAFLLLRRAALARAGRDREPFWGGLFLYNEDVELCAALRRAGFACLYVREAVARHSIGGSGGDPRWKARLAARNRVLTLLSVAQWADVASPRTWLTWTRRLWLDSGKLAGTLLRPEERRAALALLREVPARRRARKA